MIANFSGSIVQSIKLFNFHLKNFLSLYRGDPWLSKTFVDGAVKMVVQGMEERGGVGIRGDEAQELANALQRTYCNLNLETHWVVLAISPGGGDSFEVASESRVPHFAHHSLTLDLYFFIWLLHSHE
jgi:hypothetical protein